MWNFSKTVQDLTLLSLVAEISNLLGIVINVLYFSEF